MADRLQVTRSCSISLAELEWRFLPVGGPGGQHANRSHTGVEVVFDIASSPSLGPRQRSRLQQRLGDRIRVGARDERSQARNRALALERLRERLADGLREERPRQATKPTRASRERRLADKRRRADIKRSRGRIDDA